MCESVFLLLLALRAAVGRCAAANGLQTLFICSYFSAMTGYKGSCGGGGCGVALGVGVRTRTSLDVAAFLSKCGKNGKIILMPQTHFTEFTHALDVFVALTVSYSHH